ncbi:MAG: T9SS type A sorting domain-containing protein [Bacteroidales bacterium]|nr:T9SS type A sorting domain-containing protein [Bacteroidales bacterium]
MKKFTLRITALLMFLAMGTFVMAQSDTVLTIIPQNATAWDEITIILDANLSCPDSALFEADSVMMHSGATINGAAWSIVVEFNGEGANGQKPKLEPYYGKMPAAITITPENATAWDEITLTLDAKLSCPDSSLFGADSVMMHSGVTIDGDVWQNVVDFDALGANGQQPKLINNGDTTWSITYIPAEFYGIEAIAGLEVSQICCVFNAGSWGAGEGKDFDDEGNCTDFYIPLVFENNRRWAITFTPADFFGIDPDSVANGMQCVFNNGTWDAVGKAHDPDNPGQCIDFVIPFSVVGIREYTEVTFKLYPNPVDNILTIEKLDGANKIEVYNVVGKLIKTVDKISTPVVTINTADLTSGIYFIIVYNNGSAQSTKFIKN